MAGLEVVSTGGAAVLVAARPFWPKSWGFRRGSGWFTSEETLFCGGCGVFLSVETVFRLRFEAVLAVFSEVLERFKTVAEGVSPCFVVSSLPSVTAQETDRSILLLSNLVQVLDPGLLQRGVRLELVK